MGVMKQIHIDIENFKNGMKHKWNIELEVKERKRNDKTNDNKF